MLADRQVFGICSSITQWEGELSLECYCTTSTLFTEYFELKSY